MQDEQSSLGPELTGFEAQLAALKPGRQLDRDRLMFEAGRRSAARRLRTTTRLLMTTGMMCGGLVALLVLDLGRGPDADPIRQAAQSPTVSSRDPGTSVSPTETPEDKLRGGAVALMNEPTNFRLRQSYDRGLDAPLGKQPVREPFPQVHDEVSSQDYPRALLRLYLQDAREHM